jgi:peptide/nickel transport system substrate-binding protein
VIKDMKNRSRFAVLTAGLVMAVASVVPAAAQAPEEFPREETLYTSGKQWGQISSWNPIANWAYAMGALGLVYEPLFNYDPMANEYIPWLAESGEWTADDEYTIKLREGITWADGEPLTADDVVYTIELGKNPVVPYSNIWTFIDSVEKVDDLTVLVKFSDPRHHQWANFLYDRAILPVHLWGDLPTEQPEDQTAMWIMGANLNPEAGWFPVGTGPYEYLSHDQTRQVWQKRDGWWGTEALGLDPKPKYIIDLVNTNNATAMGLVLQGGMDLSNNFLPGVAGPLAGGYGLTTYYAEPPYMIPANTAWMVADLTQPPLDDPAFRKALATSVNVTDIVEKIFGNMVAAASPTGLLPVWEQWVDQALVEELGFSYDPEAAKQMLADAGYVDTDGDGFVENKDGSAIELELIVPNGWTDWMESIRVVASSAQAAGINVQTAFPEFPAYTEQLQTGDFDLAIDNRKNLSNTPWTFYNYLFRLPISERQLDENFGRYENEAAWELVNQLDRTPVDDTEALQSVYSELQRVQLTDLPAIPLWYNGAWSQMSSQVWTNWPSDGGNHFLPVTWNGYWQMGGIRMLDALEHPEPAA